MTRMKTKKTLLCFATAFISLTIVFSSSCEVSSFQNETEITYATRQHVTSSTAFEDTSLSETEQNATETTVETEQTAAETLPISVIESPVAPEDYYDHSAQLVSLGISKESKEYAFYNALFDISCKVAYYERLNVLFGTNDQITIKKYFLKSIDEMKEIADALLRQYNVYYPNNSVLPPEFEMPDLSAVGIDQIKLIEQKLTEKNEFEMAIIEELVGDIHALFLRAELAGYSGTAEMLRLSGETLESINFVKPYINDPLYGVSVETYDEYDAELDMVRLTVKTSGNFIDDYKKVGNDLYSGCKIESYTENGDGTVTLTALISRLSAFANCVRLFQKSDEGQYFYITDSIGLQGAVIHHFQYPYYESSGIDWDAPVRVKSEQLHKALSLFFRDLKGTEEYTMRDLSMITTLKKEVTIGGEEYLLINIDGNLWEFVYPEYYAVAQKNEFGGALLPNSQIYHNEGETIDAIPAEDLAMFVNLGI